jgi:sn1-specific diacylglycerol lipase
VEAYFFVFFSYTNGSHGIVDDLLRIPEYSDYTIRLTGHSLGAGCAAILSFMLRKKHPNLRCHCFCPPGCTMSENMADRCKDYLTSYIFDHDIVPRLTLDSMDHFRDDIFEMIARVKVAKREAIKAGPDVSEEVLLYGSNNVPPSRYSEQLKLLHEYQENIRSKRHTRGVPLFPPGQIVHLVRTSGQEVNTTGCCLGRAPAADGAENQAEIRRSMDYAARWAHRSDLAEIVISSHMVSDHSAPNMLSELAATADLFGIASPFLVQQDDI